VEWNWRRRSALLPPPSAHWVAAGLRTGLSENPDKRVELPRGSREPPQTIRIGESNGRDGFQTGSDGGGSGFLGKDFTDASDLCSDGAQLLFDVFIAAIDVVHAIDDGFAIGDQGSQYQRG
jgi:hypothetical protein